MARSGTTKQRRSPARTSRANTEYVEKGCHNSVGEVHARWFRTRVFLSFDEGDRLYIITRVCGRWPLWLTRFSLMRTLQRQFWFQASGGCCSRRYLAVSTSPALSVSLRLKLACGCVGTLLLIPNERASVLSMREPGIKKGWCRVLDYVLLGTLVDFQRGHKPAASCSCAMILPCRLRDNTDPFQPPSETPQAVYGIIWSTGESCRDVPLSRADVVGASCRAAALFLCPGGKKRRVTGTGGAIVLA